MADTYHFPTRLKPVRAVSPVMIVYRAISTFDPELHQGGRDEQADECRAVLGGQVGPPDELTAALGQSGPYDAGADVLQHAGEGGHGGQLQGGQAAEWTGVFVGGFGGHEMGSEDWRY